MDSFENFFKFWLKIENFFRKNVNFALYILYMVRSSINILQELWEFVVVRINEFGNFSLYLQYLLNRYGIQFQNRTRDVNGNILTQYQPDDSNFIIRNVRVREGIWLLLNGIKQQTGYSMSYLIRVMVEWDMQEQNIDRESLLELDQTTGVMEDEFIVLNEHRLEIRIDFAENRYFWESVLEYVNQTS